MPGIDTTPYTTLGQNQPNLLGSMMQYAYAQNALNQNKLFQQTFQARQRIGQIAAQSRDPQGNFDRMGFINNISGDPVAAPFAAEIINQMANAGMIEANTAKTNLEVSTAKMGAIANAAYAAGNAMTGDPSAPADTTHVLRQAANLLPQVGPDGQPLFDPKQTVAQLTQITQGARTNGDLKARLFQLAQAYQSASDRNGNIGWQTQTDPMTGQPKLVAFNKMQGGPSGAPLPGQSAGPTLPAPATGGGTSAAASQGGAGGGSTVPPAAAVSATSNAAPQASPTQATSSVVGTPMGPTAAQAGGLKYMSDTYYPELQNAARQAQNYLNIVSEGKSLLRDVATGRAAPARLEIARWLTSAGVSEQTARQVAGGDPYNAQALQKLILYIGTQGMRQANVGNAAVRSVQEWNKFMEANPNLANDKQAINKMWDFMQYQSSLVTQEQNEYNGWLRDGKNPTLFPASWNNFVNQQTQKYMQSRQMGVQSGQ